MDIKFNSKLFLIQTDATISELNHLEAKIKNIEVFPVLFVNDFRSIDACIILNRMWDVDDFSFAVFLPVEIVKAIITHLKKYGLKPRFKNIDSDVFYNKYDLTAIEHVLRGLVYDYIICIRNHDDVLDKMGIIKDYKLTEIDKSILLKKP
ncbi:MAG: hypothetical protein H7141_12325 [Burkholderiales bacterium]|nr:hypothetical protein [Bacteroidia bacterium]